MPWRPGKRLAPWERRGKPWCHLMPSSRRCITSGRGGRKAIGRRKMRRFGPGPIPSFLSRRKTDRPDRCGTPTCKRRLPICKPGGRRRCRILWRRWSRRGWRRRHGQGNGTRATRPSYRRRSRSCGICVARKASSSRTGQSGSSPSNGNGHCPDSRAAKTSACRSGASYR